MATRETLEPRLAACKTAGDLYTLAREAFDDPADMAYAKDVLSSAAFTGGAGAKAALDKVAGDAMFTKDFVALAIGYKALGDADKAQEMLDQGADFAMDGSEKVAVGMGQWLAMGDAAAASKALAGALKEISATEELYGLATVVSELNDAALIGQVADKIKAKAGRAADFARLARLVAATDKAKAVEVIGEGAGKYSSPSDLIQLSAAMGEIDPAAADALYDRALESAKDFAALMQVLEAAKGNPAFTGAVLAKGGAIAGKAAEFLQLAEVYAGLGDAAGLADVLTKAEGAVANLDEMRKVVEAVDRHAAGDTTRVQRLKGRLAKREANQAKYVAIQNEEAQAKTVKQLIGLADRVMAELEDAAYAAKLLKAAEELMRADGFHFSRFKPLILAVDRLGDKAWLGQLLKESVDSAGDFLWFREIVLTAAREFRDSAFGKERAKAYLEARAGSAGENPYDWTKLAETVQVALGDASWAARLLDEAAGRARDHFSMAYIGRLYRDLGDAAKAKAMFDRAVQACTTAEDCVQLANRLKTYALPASDIVAVMDACGSRMTSADDKLCWAEGVADLLLDSSWAEKAYAGIAPAFTGEVDRKRFERSRQMRMGYRFFGPGVQAH
jgi:tetratricopeptide (TPR) repeat protein